MPSWPHTQAQFCVPHSQPGWPPRVRYGLAELRKGTLCRGTGSGTEHTAKKAGLGWRKRHWKSNTELEVRVDHQSGGRCAGDIWICGVLDLKVAKIWQPGENEKDILESWETPAVKREGQAHKDGHRGQCTPCIKRTTLRASLVLTMGPAFRELPQHS